MSEDNDELCDLYSSPYIIWVIKKSGEEMDSQDMGHIWEPEVLTRFWWGDLMEENPLEVLGLDGRVLLKLNFKK